MVKPLASRTLVTGRTQVNRPPKGWQGPGTGGGGGTPPPPPPLDAPVLVSGPTASAITSTSVTINFTSDQFVQAYVDYGTTTGYGSESTHETSFLYKSHVVTLINLAADTTYHFRVRLTNQDGLTYTGVDTTFHTAASGGVGVGYTEPPILKTVVWPTGAGYTSGATSTVRTNLVSLLTSNGSGSASGFVKHSLPAGAVYTVDKNIFTAGLHHLLFEGNGTPIHTVSADGTITQTGNIGGATIRMQVGYWADSSGNNCIFSTLSGGDSSKAQDIRWHALNLEGDNPYYAGGSNMAHGGNEGSAGIGMYGLDGGEIAYCNFDKFKGDCIHLDGSAGSTTAPNDFRTRNVRIHHSSLRRAGRVCYFPAKAAAITIEDCRFDSAAYGLVDCEPDWYTMVNGTHDFRRCTFTGDQNQSYPPFMACLFMSRVNTQSGQFQIDGRWTIDSCVFSSRNLSGNQTELHTAGGSNIWKAGITFTNNKRTAFAHAGPVIYLDHCHASAIVTNNSGFLTSGSFVQDGGDNTGGITQSNNS